MLTHDRLDELAPIDPAAMKDRPVIEWEKDDIDALKFMEVDCLALSALPISARRQRWPVCAPGQAAFCGRGSPPHTCA